MQKRLAKLVRRRAGDRCEYCHLPKKLTRFTFHIDHILPRQHGGRTVRANLALACNECNARKGPNLAGIDPLTGKIARLFHPRRDSWPAHFTWSGPELFGLTGIGRATVFVLGINNPERLEMRQVLLREGLFPP